MAAIDNKESSVLLKFRDHVSDLELTEAQKSDYFLIRWIRARGNDLDKAKTMLSNYLEYRKKENVDNILSWEPPADVKTLAPYQLLGVDNENCPVIFVPFNKWKCRKLADLGLASDVVKYIDRLYEEIESTMIAKTTPEGIPVTQYVFIIDTYNISMMNLSSFTVVDGLLQIARKFEAFHPESVKRFYIPNAGRAFTAAFTLVKPILGARTAEKFQIFGTKPDVYKTAMLKEIPGKILPPKFGGTNTETLDADYIDEEEENEDELEFMAVTIPGGEKLVMNFGVDEYNSTITWAFKTEKYDISFGVTRDGKAYIEKRKVDSHVDLQEGTITCDQPGDYIFTFDNSYSRLRSKALSYRIDVKSPSGVKQISFD